MALVFADRVKETSTTAGTGALTLAGASTGFQSFAVIGNGNTTYYAIVDSIANTWEVGVGTYTSSGTTLTRNTVLSNSLGTTAFISFAANSKDVFVTYAAGKSVYQNAAGQVSGFALTGDTVDSTPIGATTPSTGVFTTVTATAATTASANKGAINYGTLGFSDTGIAQSAQTSVNSYFQNVIQNTSNGTTASSEYIAYNDGGTPTTNYAAFGINSSGYTGTGSINTAGYSFFVSGSTDLVLGTIGANNIRFVTNSAATDALAISSAGAVSLPGGTANGVAYLNGSKVLTTGTALTFDGTNLGVGGSALIQGLTVGRGAGAIASNTAVGASALAANTTGAGNTALGNQAGFSNTTGAITAIGYKAGYANVSANYGTFIGYNAGVASTGDANTLVGYIAGQSISSGANNTMVGVLAGYQLTTGSNNTFIGAYAGASNSAGSLVTTGSKNTIIGAYNGNQGGLDIRTASNFIVLSDGDGNPRQIIDSAGNLGIGTAAPAVKLVVNSTDAVGMPAGTTAQRPTGVAGYLRYNTTLTQFEGYNGTAWASVGGATLSNDTTTATFEYPLFASATSGSATTVYTSNANLLYKPSTGELQASALTALNGLVFNAKTLVASTTVATGFNAHSVGPFTVPSGLAVTVSSGSRWVIL